MPGHLATPTPEEAKRQAVVQALRQAAGTPASGPRPTNAPRLPQIGTRSRSPIKREEAVFGSQRAVRPEDFARFGTRKKKLGVVNIGGEEYDITTGRGVPIAIPEPAPPLADTTPTPAPLSTGPVPIALPHTVPPRSTIPTRAPLDGPVPTTVPRSIGPLGPGGQPIPPGPAMGAPSRGGLGGLLQGISRAPVLPGGESLAGLQAGSSLLGETFGIPAINAIRGATARIPGAEKFLNVSPLTRPQPSPAQLAAPGQVGGGIGRLLGSQPGAAERVARFEQRPFSEQLPAGIIGEAPIPGLGFLNIPKAGAKAAATKGVQAVTRPGVIPNITRGAPPTVARPAAPIIRPGTAAAEAMRQRGTQVGPAGPALADLIRRQAPPSGAAPTVTPPGAAQGARASKLIADELKKGVAPEGAATSAATQRLAQYLLRPITAGLKPLEKGQNVVRHLFKAAPDDPIATRAFKERQEINQIVGSLANNAQELGKRTNTIFKVDGNGRVAHLAHVIPELGAPTVQDIAARLPLYLPHLSTQELAIMGRLADDMAGYRGLLEGAGATITTRGDIMEGGFYLHRGSALAGEIEDAITVLSRNRPGRVTSAAEKAAKQPSMAQGIDAGYVYSPFGEALSTFVRESSQRAVDSHILRWSREQIGELIPGEPTKGVAFKGVGREEFPEAFANAANRILAEESPNLGAFEGTIKAFNTLYRGTRATADLSYQGIQGLLGLGDNPKAYRAAMSLAFKSWRNPKVLEKFIDDLNTKALSEGLPPVQELVAAGVRVGGEDTEFAWAIGKVNLPIVKESNRAFGFFGDALRLDWTYTQIRRELAGGRTPDLQDLAKATNMMTGYSPNQFMGRLGDVLLFAPRYFQSRLDSAALAIKGVRPGAKASERAARQAFLKMIGYGTLLTWGINEVLGEETDFRPIINGRKNPNFMRIRAAGRDWSLFGPWDSFLGLTIGVGTADFDAVRSVSSGLVNFVWDASTGTNAIGEPAYRGDKLEIGKNLAENFVPFALTEVPEVGRRLTSGDYGGAAATTIGELSGIKSANLSRTDVGSMILEDENLIPPAGKNLWGDTERFLRDFADTYPEVEAARGDQSLPYRIIRDEEQQNLAELSRQMNQAQGLSGKEKSNALFGLRMRLAVVRAKADGASKQENRDKEFPSKGNKLMSRYYAVLMDTRFQLAPDVWDSTKRSVAVEAFMLTLSQDERDYVARNTNLDPLPTNLLSLLSKPERTGYIRSQEARETYFRKAGRMDMIPELRRMYLFNPEGLPSPVAETIDRQVGGSTLNAQVVEAMRAIERFEANKR